MAWVVHDRCMLAIAGLRVGTSDSKSASGSASLLQHFDHVLLDKEEVWPAVRPDVILQLGGRISSKRTSEFLAWAAQPSGNRYYLRHVLHAIQQGALELSYLFCFARCAPVARCTSC